MRETQRLLRAGCDSKRLCGGKLGLRETNRRRVRGPIQQRDVAGVLDEAGLRHRCELGENTRTALLVTETDPHLHELVIGQGFVQLLAERIGDAARTDVDDRCQSMTEDAQIIGLLFGEMHPLLIVRAALAGAVGRE